MDRSHGNVVDAPMYDVCIVGAGMTGSAAARWVSEQGGLKSCLIGPLEPTEEEWSDPSRTVFGSHYDPCRIISELAASRRDETWPVLLRRSVSRFKKLEKDSGIRFFEEVGCLVRAGKQKFAEMTSKMRPQLDVTFYKGEELVHSFPYFNSGEDKKPCNHENGSPTGKEDLDLLSALEGANAGYIHPGNYIAANTTLATNNGCAVLSDVVCEITQVEDDHAGEEAKETTAGRLYMRVVTKSGRALRARRVLLCAGAFTNCERLLPDVDQREVDLSLTSEAVLFVEVCEKDAGRLSAMPCTACYCDDSYDPRNMYLSPPIKYPDGKIYIKVGHGPDLNQPLVSYNDVTSWFRLRSHQIPTSRVKSLYARFAKALPDLKPISVKARTCVTTSTPTDRFYCDMMTPTLGVIAGGNGSGAGVADEIGRMGALMIINGTWKHDLPAESFELQYKMNIHR